MSYMYVYDIQMYQCNINVMNVCLKVVYVSIKLKV